MTVTSVLLIAQALFGVIDHENRPRGYSSQAMAKGSRSVQTSTWSRTLAKTYLSMGASVLSVTLGNCVTPVGRLTLWAQKFSKSCPQSSKHQFCLSVKPLSLSLSSFMTKKDVDNQKKRTKRQKSLSLSISAIVRCFLVCLKKFDWHWRGNLICRCGC